MFVRAAYFEGKITAGNQDRFENLVKQRIAPAMGRIPGIRRLEFRFGRDFETRERSICFCIEHGYDSLDDIQRAITSDARKSMQADLDELMSLFEGRLYHVNYEMMLT